MKDACTIIWEVNVIGRTSRMTLITLQGTGANVPKTNQSKKDDAFTNIYVEWPVGIGRSGNFGTTHEDAERQKFCTGDDGSLPEINERCTNV